MYNYITEEVFINGIFPYQFSVFESIIENDNTYFAIYSHDNEYNNYNDGNYFSIKKFYFYENNDQSINVQLIQSSEKFAIKSCRMISGFMADNQFIFVIFFSIKNSNNQCDLNLKKYDYENLICQEDKTLISNIFIKEYSDIFLSNVF